ncbi:unnamed protein product [Triticum turgidum subsp. durum]|uniref:Uncharacterized protein n=1 Tax=Triticum turgidum subsp. durum TaxID=4567 RepID=A0A9R0Y3P1_TRITD|nr:unnamed protein product [Triticum turgidum subsp. durum]
MSDPTTRVSMLPSYRQSASSLVALRLCRRGQSRPLPVGGYLPSWRSTIFPKKSTAALLEKHCCDSHEMATGEVYPLELADSGASKECKTGDVVTVDLDNSVLINHTSGKQYKLKPIGDAGPVIEAGGIFAYARKAGMIASKSA